MIKHYQYEHDNEFFYQKLHRTRSVNMAQSHLHQNYEIYYLLSGERQYFIGNSSYCIKPHDIVLIPKEVPHKTTSALRAEHERILVSVPDSWLTTDEKNVFAKNCIHIPQPLAENCESILGRIEYEYNLNDRYSEEMIVGAVHELMVFLSRIIENSADSLIAEANGSMAERAAQYICEHYGEPLTLEDLATEFSLSREYFSSKFKQTTGFGFSEYLNQVRVANASRMLRSGSVSVTDVAYRCGFNDSNYFATVFKRIRGVSPKKYQLMQSKNEK